MRLNLRVALFLLIGLVAIGGVWSGSQSSSSTGVKSATIVIDFGADSGREPKVIELTGVPVIPTLMAWGAIPDDHPLMAGMCGLQTSHRYGNATMLASDFVLGIGNRWANRHTGSVEVYTQGRKFVHVDIEPTQIGRVFNPDLGIVSDAKIALELFVQVARERKAAGQLKDFGNWAVRCAERKKLMQRKTHFDNVPIKPQRVYEEMNAAFGRDTVYVSTIGLSQIAGAQFLHVYGPRQWINCGQAGPLGWTLPAALGVVAADPTKQVVALSGDYDFQFLIEELAVGAQFRLPYVQVLVNNSYLGLIRQSQRGFDMDYCVQLAFENQNVPEEAGELRGYGVNGAIEAVNGEIASELQGLDGLDQFKCMGGHNCNSRWPARRMTGPACTLKQSRHALG